jgi:hypothetical protein
MSHQLPNRPTMLATVFLAAACSSPPEGTEAAPPAPSDDQRLAKRELAAAAAEPGLLHLVAVTEDRRLLHTIRRANGAWDHFGEIEGQTGDIGVVHQANARYSAGGLFVPVLTRFTPPFFTNEPFFTIRSDNGGWVPFVALHHNASVREFSHHNIALGRTNNGDVHFCSSGPTDVVHGIRRASTGSFGGFNSVGFATLTVLDSSLAADCDGVGDELHLALGTFFTNSDGRVRMTIRRADGTWTPFQDTHRIPANTNAGDITELDLESSSDGTLHLLVTTVRTQFHAMKSPGGSWSALGNVEQQAGDPGSSGISDGGAALVGGELHVSQVTHDGRLMHAIRFANGGWSRFGDVGAAVPGGNAFGPFMSVGLSRSTD